jgi:hypothetical protein
MYLARGVGGEGGIVCTLPRVTRYRESRCRRATELRHGVPVPPIPRIGTAPCGAGLPDGETDTYSLYMSEIDFIWAV